MAAEGVDEPTAHQRLLLRSRLLDVTLQQVADQVLRASPTAGADPGGETSGTRR